GGAIPEVGGTASLATGATFEGGADTVTAAEAEPVAPLSSVTVTRAVHVPAAYVCVAVAAACGPTMAPSPKSKRYDAIGVASVSVDADASAVTACGADPEGGLTASATDGGASTAPGASRSCHWWDSSVIDGH